jgi:hypothetical protein
MRKARRYCRALFFSFTEEDGKFLNGGHGNVAAIVAGKKGLRNTERGSA